MQFIGDTIVVTISSKSKKFKCYHTQKALNITKERKVKNISIFSVSIFATKLVVLTLICFQKD